MNERKEQFNSFVHSQLPNELIDIIFVQLLAEYIARQKNCKKDIAAKLHRASRFKFLEKQLIDSVKHNGLFFKRKSYLTLIDSPNYKMSKILLNFCSQNYGISNAVKEKIGSFKEWQLKFTSQEKKNLHADIDSIFDRICRAVPSFVDDNIENENFNNKWNKYIEQQNIQHKIQKLLEDTADKAKNKIKEMWFFVNLGGAIICKNHLCP